MNEAEFVNSMVKLANSDFVQFFCAGLIIGYISGAVASLFGKNPSS